MITLYNHNHCENQLITSTAPPSMSLKCQFLSRETALWDDNTSGFLSAWGRNRAATIQMIYQDDFPGISI